ncbi:MAG TPA: glycosyltransferase family 4 protein [Byssovorax sp.]
MHVLIVSNLYPPDVLGGYELLARDVAERFVRRGHRVTVFTSGDGSIRDGVHRTMTLARPFGDDAGRDRARHVVTARANRRALEELLAFTGKPDCALIMSLRRVGPEPLRVLDEAGIPFVVTVNDDWPSVHAEAPRRTSPRGLAAYVLDRAPFARHTFRGVSVRHVVYLSAAIRDEVLRAGAPFPNGTVVYQGVDTDVFRPDGGTGKKGELLFVGRLHPSKAPDIAIEALAELRAKGRDVRLTLAGNPVTEAYGRELRALARARGVEAHTKFVGLVPRHELPRLYHSAEAVLFLGRYAGEAQGLVPIEAMACGRPVVFAALGGAKEFVSGHDATVDAPICDGPHVAAAAARLLDDAELGRRVVERGLQLVETQGSIDAYADALLAHLEASRGDAQGRAA